MRPNGFHDGKNLVCFLPALGLTKPRVGRGACYPDRWMPGQGIEQGLFHRYYYFYYYYFYDYHYYCHYYSG